MMKRNLIIALLCLVMAVVFISCDNHTHSYSDKWSSDETYHWHAATCEHKEEVKDKAEHNFGAWEKSDKDGTVKRTCSVCDYVDTAAGVAVATKEAFNNALTDAGETAKVKLVLTADIDLENTEPIKITNNKEVEIDFNGKTLSIKEEIHVEEGKLTLSGKGKLKVSDADKKYYFALLVYGSTSKDAENYSVVNVGDITIEGKYAYGVSVKPAMGESDKETNTGYGVVVNLNGTTINAICGVYLRGTCQAQDGKVPVFNLTNVTFKQNDTELAADDDPAGVYAAGYAKWNITNCNFEASEALSLKSGNVTINGGTYKSKGEYFDPSSDTSNASVYTGAALSMTSNDSYAKKLDVTVNSGKFISENGYAVYEGIPNKKNAENTKVATESYVTLLVNGGEFVGNAGKGAVKLSDMKNKKVLKGGVYSSKPDDSYIFDGYEAKADGSSWKVVSK